MYLMSSLISVINSCEKQTKTYIHELFDVIINTIHALSAVVLTAQEVPEIQSVIQEILYISLITAMNSQHQIVSFDVTSSSCSINAYTRTDLTLN